VDPNDDLPAVVTVNGDKTINFRIPRNKNVNGTEHGRGYVMYGPSGPQGTMTLSNVNNVIAPDANAGSNGTSRITPINVIKANTFKVTLNTNKVNLLGTIRDADADGDNALLKIDGGLNINSNPGIDNVVYNHVNYGFEEFTTTHTPGYNNSATNYAGTYEQNIDATQLSEGYHYIESRAFRHRNAATEGENPPPIYSSFKSVVYIDRLPPVSAPAGVENKPFGGSNDRRFNAQSVDKTASNVYILMDIPASRTDAQILAGLTGNQATQTDRDMWARDINSATTGNHVMTVVTYEVTGNYSIQRFPGQWAQTGNGAGLGDTDRNNTYSNLDVFGFTSVLKSNNTQFNATSDFDANGLVDLTDTFLYGPKLESVNANATTMTAYKNLLADSYVTTGTWTVSGAKTVNEVTAGRTIVPATATLSARSIQGNALEVAAGGKVKIRANGTDTGMVKLSTLSLASGAALDLNDNDLIVNNGNYATISGLVMQGYRDSADTAANGIISSTGQTTVGSPILAVFDNSLLQTNTWPFGGSTVVSPNAVLGKYTYIGDADLNGMVTPDDYGAIDSNLGQTVSTAGGMNWFQGDWNFDGEITPDDYGAVDANLGNGQGGALVATGLAAQGVAAVPEPSSVLMISLGALATIRRRAKRKQR
jgi:hypothetical protein